MVSAFDKKGDLNQVSGLRILSFPERFLWGAATSHFQVEGHPLEIDGRISDWSEWTRQEGRIFDQTSADRACEFHLRYRSDIDLCKSLHLNAFRLSLNWPALCPTQPDNAGPIVLERPVVDYYRRLLSELKEEGITSFVTLFHFTLPKWLADQGGWNNARTGYEFSRFAQAAAREFGGLVDYWITINEPLAYAYQGYIAGVWPPGKSGDFAGAFSCIRGMLEGHALAANELHEHNAAVPVSYTHHWRPFKAKNPFNPMDQLVRYFRDSIFNQLFPRAVQTGVLEFPFPLGANPEVKSISGRIPYLKDSIDYLAVNYYTRELSRYVFSRPLDFFGEQSLEHELETSGLSWEVYPDGLYYLLTCDLSPYRYNSKGKERPIIVTENGYASLFSAELTEGDWSLHDHKRVNYLISHLMAVHRAIEEGANVKGYLHWSLLDNFEWAEGLRARFGLVRVAYPTQERTLRRSAQVYAEIARTNAVDPAEHLRDDHSAG